jgi:dolichol-phosphate mannosyltransferase
VKVWQQRALQLVRWVSGIRYVKFGVVGASGTVVNMAVLYLCHSYLFDGLEADLGKPYLSLAVAIAVATLNNFSWNRLWTWADRRADASSEQAPPGFLSQLFKYAIASWFGIGVQYVLTLWWSHFMHYLLANVLAIVVASVSNFLANDRWTFKKPTP